MMQGSDSPTWKTGSVDRVTTRAVALWTDIPTLDHHLKQGSLKVNGRKRW